MLSGVGDALVQLGDFRFRFLPVIRKLLLACQPPLQLLELGQELFEWGQPVYGSAFRRRDELGYPPVDPHHCRCGVSWWFYLLERDRKSTRLNSSHVSISYAVFCLKN